MHLSFNTLDVFTQTRYLGNPLAIIHVPSTLRSQLTEAQKQNIAREFNLSEVTFLHEPLKDTDTADFDIFTSKARITFAGHPTIGTAIYVAKHGAAYPGITKLQTLAGVIPIEYNESLGKATADIPHDVHIHHQTLPHPTLPASSVPIVSIVKGMAFALCALPDLETLATRTSPLIPAEDRYKAQYLDAGSGWDIGPTGTFYYVDLGIDENGMRKIRTRSIPAFEDPGTGSASAALCSYLALQKGSAGEDGVNRFWLTQGVEMGRRCDIYIDVCVKDGGKEIGDIKLSGEAVEVMEGVLRID